MIVEYWLMKEILDASILVIDDSEFSRALLKTALGKIGFRNVRYIGSSIEGWELIANNHVEGNPYDLVITDLNMPDLDGIDLIQKVKEDPISENQKIIVVSGDADLGIKMVCKALGVLAYFTKPIKTESLKEILFAIFEGKEEIPEVEDLI